LKKLLLTTGIFMLTACGPYSSYKVYEDVFKIDDIGNDMIIRQTPIEDDFCKSGSGLLIESGIDLNNNGTLDSGEITDSNILCSGVNGSDGKDGQDGTDGEDGMDGEDGQDGEDGTDGIVELIDPCGNGPGFDEVLFRLSSGALVAWYKNLGLAVLTPGTYRTTDKQRCTFTVHSDLSVTW